MRFMHSIFKNPPLTQTNVYFFNKIPTMPSITDNFIIEVPTM